jgi:Transglutaminase-like superfamily
VFAWIRTARRFRHLDPAERCLVLEAALFTVAVRLALSALSLRTVRGLLAHIPSVASPVSGDAAEHIARAVTRARAGVPGATCLMRALVVQTLLVRRGHSAHLRLGFVRSAKGVLSGHAWVVSEGRVFDDTGEASGYAPAPDFAVQRS